MFPPEMLTLFPSAYPGHYAHLLSAPVSFLLILEDLAQVVSHRSFLMTGPNALLIFCLYDCLLLPVFVKADCVFFEDRSCGFFVALALSMVRRILGYVQQVFVD